GRFSFILRVTFCQFVKPFAFVIVGSVYPALAGFLFGSFFPPGKKALRSNPESPLPAPEPDFCCADPLPSLYPPPPKIAPTPPDPPPVPCRISLLNGSSPVSPLPSPGIAKLPPPRPPPAPLPPPGCAFTLAALP